MITGAVIRVVTERPYDWSNDPWQGRLMKLTDWLERWARNYLNERAAAFQQITVSSISRWRVSTEDSDDDKVLSLKGLDWARGMYLQLGFNVMVFIYDKYEPWYHTPEREGPAPLNTGTYTNVGDTVNVAYVPPQSLEVGNDPDHRILQSIIYPLSGDLAYVILYPRLPRDDFIELWKQTEKQGSEGVSEPFDDFQIIPIDSKLRV